MKVDSSVFCVLPGGEWRGRFLLAWSVNMDHSKVLGDLLHVLEVKECVETGLICFAKEQITCITIRKKRREFGL